MSMRGLSTASNSFRASFAWLEKCQEMERYASNAHESVISQINPSEPQYAIALQLAVCRSGNLKSALIRNLRAHSYGFEKWSRLHH